MSLRFFLDANVLFTAVYNPRGLARLLFDLHRRGSLLLLTSRLAIAEARVNLEIKKAAAVDDLRELVAETELVDAPTQPALGLDLPPKDLAIFSAGPPRQSDPLSYRRQKSFWSLLQQAEAYWRNHDSDNSGILRASLRFGVTAWGLVNSALPSTLTRLDVPDTAHFDYHSYLS